MSANFQLSKLIFEGEDRFFSLKIRFENSNNLADFNKIYNFEGSKNPEKSKFQDLLDKIFRSPQYLSPKPKLAPLDQ